MFFAWAQGYLGASDDGHEPQRLAQQLHAEKLRIVRAIPEFGDRTVVPDLIALLRGDDPALVNQAVFALESLTGRNLGGDVQAWLAYEAGAAQPPAPGAAIPK